MVSSSMHAKTTVVMVVVVALLVVISSCGEGVQATSTTTCVNEESYDGDAGFAANVNTILEGMRIATANGGVYTRHLTFPDVYGRSTCTSSLEVAQCVQCVSEAVADMRNACPLMKAATTTGGDGLCTAKYSTVDITAAG